MSTRVAIIGAGPAGLTAAYELTKQSIPAVVLEADSVVGGIARTARYKDYLFDIGGHRFFTKVGIVEALWDEVLGEDMLTRKRSSRILYRGRFFRYPLEPMDALMGLGPVEATRCVLSYLFAKVLPQKPEEDFETWVSNRFGQRLFKIFFETYTEKVWGMSCKEIRAEWAAQRIKDLSLRTVLQEALLPKPQDKQAVIKTLVHEFRYPRRGPGMLWERIRDRIVDAGQQVFMNHPVEEIRWKGHKITSLLAAGQEFDASHYICTMPIRELVQRMRPEPPKEVLDAANRLKYRDFLTVAVMMKDRGVFDDNWIYVHDPSVKVGRVQNFKSWSPEMIPDTTTTCLGLEYFCSEGDALWDASDEELKKLGAQEVVKLGLAKEEDILDATVVRMKKAYPVYDAVYASALETILDFIKSFPNLQLVGRNGMHRYNNQDHSMLTAMLAVRNIQGANYDLWRVNADSDYHEEGSLVTAEEFAAMQQTQPAHPEQIHR